MPPPALTFNDRMLAAVDDAACDQVHAIFTAMDGRLASGDGETMNRLRPEIRMQMNNIKSLHTEFHAIIAEVFQP